MCNYWLFLSLATYACIYSRRKKFLLFFLPSTYRCVALTKWVEFGKTKTKKRTHSIFVHAFVWGEIFFPLLSTFICIVHTICSVKKIKSIKLLHICKKMTSFFFSIVQISKHRTFETRSSIFSSNPTQHFDVVSCSSEKNLQ